VLERDGYPAGVPCWVDTEQADPAAAAAFYGGLLGWDFVEPTPPGSPQRYFIAQLRGRDVAGIGSQPEGRPPAPAWNTYVRVDSADAAAARARDAGGTVLTEPFDVADAGRMSALADPSGAAFRVWEPRARKGAQLVNEPGTWNFSELNTRDIEGAKAFYGALFGWEARMMDMGGGFFRMPGYGDFLEQLNPGTRARMADVGAPEGFEDAVAWLVPMTGDQFPDDAAPHWSITFAVDDADAIAGRAGELGGELLVPPMDAPWVRMSVISDPAGAAFTASKFVPPS
jgi:predicted enzyme related to lactoylglutathione lyase